jgi:hypothetical protein
MSIIPVNDNFYKISNDKIEEINLKNIELSNFSINLQKLIEIKLNKNIIKPFITLEQLLENNQIYIIEIHNYLNFNNIFLEIINKLNDFNEKDYNTNIIELKKLYDNNDKEFNNYVVKFNWHVIKIYNEVDISIIRLYLISQIYHINQFFNFLNDEKLKNSLCNCINRHKYSIKSININSKLISDLLQLFDYLQKK